MRQERELLASLVERVLELAALPEQESKKRMWSAHQALRWEGRSPVCVYFEGIPADLRSRGHGGRRRRRL